MSISNNYPLCIYTLTIHMYIRVSFYSKPVEFAFRYYAIVHPLSAMKVNSKSRTKKIIAATWVIPAILATPYCFSRAQPFTITSELGTTSGEYCSDRFDELDGHTGDFRRIFFVILFIVMYFNPLAIIVVTCTKIAICLTRPFVVGNSAPCKQDPTAKRRHEVNKRKVWHKLFPTWYWT